MTKRKAILFTEQQLVDALALHDDSLPKTARYLSAMGEGKVTTQLLRSWISRFDHTALGQKFDRAKELAKVRNQTAENNKLRRDNRALAGAVGTKEMFTDALAQVVMDLGEREPVTYRGYIGPQAGTPMIVELLLSDLQIGKLSATYNTRVAKLRLAEYCAVALFQIEQKIAAGYRIEKIMLGLLGDIIESDKKHENSAKATDTSTSEQIFDAIDSIFSLVIEPLARLGIPMEVVGIVGNHDWDGHGMNSFEPGKSMLSWPLYKSLELLTGRCGYINVQWTIPQGTYAVVDFYGQKAIYEHGYGTSNQEASLKRHKINRAEQEQSYITYLRVGDKHTVTSYNAGQLVVNGAFFGAGAGGGEYSEIAGYASVPGQWMGFHVKRAKSCMLTLYDSFVIQLGGVTDNG